MVINKGLVLAFAAGAVVGIVGSRFVQNHKEDLAEKLKGLKQRAENLTASAAAGSSAESAPETEESDAESDVTLEELEAQKERLEDLIAEMQAGKGSADGTAEA